MQAIIFLIGVVVALIIGAFSNFNADVDVETILGAAAVWIFTFTIYCTAFWSLTGQTPGMRVLGIEVSTVEGPRLGVRRSLVRLVGMLLAAIPLFLGYLPILLRDDRRGLHDLMAGATSATRRRSARPAPLRRCQRFRYRTAPPTIPLSESSTFRCPARS